MPQSTRLICRQCGGPRRVVGDRLRCPSCNAGFERKRRANLSAEQREAERVRGEALRAERRALWTPEQRATQNARVQAWRDADPERHRAGSRDWYARNAEQARSAKRAEYYADPEKFYAQNWVRKARLADAVCEHGLKCVSAKFIKSVQGGVCLYCGAQAEAADHFNPIARGGLHCVDNLVPACGSCNSRKSASEPIAWLISVGILVPVA